VKIQIKYMVNLRERVGRQQEEVSFPPGSTLQDVAAWLNTRYDFALPHPRIMAILNGRGWDQLPSKWATQVQEGDIICLFPPISGG
jgi:molybdopterin converting factor small subunit